LFSCVWQATAYPLKRCAGLEGDMLWIECAPEEVAQYHLEELEKAVSQTNANYRFNVEQRAAAEQRQRELNARTQAQLDELGDYLDSSADSAVAGDTSEAIRPNLFGGVIGLLRWLSGIRRRDAGEMVSYGA
jgi:chromosome segregation ATPase